jgi:hypothetical protein
LLSWNALDHWWFLRATAHLDSRKFSQNTISEDNFF